MRLHAAGTASTNPLAPRFRQLLRKRLAGDTKVPVAVATALRGSILGLPTGFDITLQSLLAMLLEMLAQCDAENVCLRVEDCTALLSSSYSHLSGPDSYHTLSKTTAAVQVPGCELSFRHGGSTHTAE